MRLAAVLGLAALAAVDAFQLPRRPVHAAPRAVRVAAAAVAVPNPPSSGPLTLHVGSKTINLTGLWFGTSMTVWVIALYPLVLTAALISRVFDPKKKRPMDFMVWLWARCSMLTCLYRPKVTGRDNLPKKGVPVLIVPNHCSYLDILTLSAFMPRPFKYISKVEILRIPFIGWAMGFAGHIALRRADRRSQLQTFKDTVESLKNGNSVVAFAEGTRSVDGTLQKFKRGPFKMATTSGVGVVPVALCDLHKWHPPSALMPMAIPRHVELKVLPLISTKGKNPDDVMRECQAAVDAALPAHQQSRGAKVVAPSNAAWRAACDASGVVSHYDFGVRA
jgi:1-acyl-sn-glycerol-3-phosphate acyltransferase